MTNKVSNLKSLAATIPIALSGAAIAQPGPQASGSVSLGYAPTNNSLELRFEGTAHFTDNISVYGYLDLRGDRGEFLDISNRYAEVMVNYTLGEVDELLEGVGAAIEYNGGNNANNLLMVGLTAGGLVGDNTYVFGKLMYGEDGFHPGIYVEHDFNDKLSLGFEGTYSTQTENLQLEFQADYKLTGNLSGYGRVKINDPLNEYPEEFGIHNATFGLGLKLEF